ncbi:eukaryotic translation initiation factor 3 subunit J [Megalopta genalis]|uniref:eukaryotic translation initiation factor 3 subunit J n=1 Tax=Megalopta genalis TaxID=115081 RepID=UPI0014433093|nr:eukaryotic translation initiation factor 3 subunit J [Megalopta genalis]
MDDEWDVVDAEGKFDLAITSNKWEGEDEEEDVKDSWEDVEEEKKEVEKKEVEKPAELPKAKPKPKKALAERIEEREKKAREEAERKAKEKEESLTPEEKRAEQLKRQRLQEEADLRLAMETFGVTTEEGVLSLDSTVPDTKEEFDQYGYVLAQKINQFAKHSEFPPFAEELVKIIALNLSSINLKKVKTMIDNLLIEKQKVEKGDKAKKNKGKGKAKLNIEGENTLLSEYGDYVYDDYNDFM